MIDSEDDGEAALGSRLRRACEWTEPALVERDDDEEEWFGHWSPDWACWEIKPSHPAPRAMVPFERLLGTDGEIDPGFLVRRSARLMIAAGIRGPHPAPEELACAADVLAAEAATRAHWRRYVAAIPAAHRRMVGPFPRHQWRLLMALAAEPELERDLAVELAAAGPGYVFACLSFVERTGPCGAADAAMLAAALRRKRPAMLARLARRPVTSGQARLLGKLESILQRRTALRMLALAADPTLGHVLGHLPVLSRALCAIAAELPRRMVTPALLNTLARRKIDFQTRWVFVETAQKIERRAPERREAFLRAVCGARASSALCDVAAEWNATLRRPRRPPTSPFAGDARLAPVPTLTALRAAGRRFGNCLSARDMAGHYLANGDAFYEWRGAHRAIVRLSRNCGAWAIAEIQDAGHDTPPRRVCERIARHVYRGLADASAPAKR